ADHGAHRRSRLSHADVRFGAILPSAQAAGRGEPAGARAGRTTRHPGPAEPSYVEDLTHHRLVRPAPQIDRNEGGGPIIETGLKIRVETVKSKLQPPRVLVGVGFLMLLLTSLQGWGMVAIIAAAGEGQTPLLQELKRLHNLGLTGGFLAIAFGLAMIVLPLD